MGLLNKISNLLLGEYKEDNTGAKDFGTRPFSSMQGAESTPIRSSNQPSLNGLDNLFIKYSTLQQSLKKEEESLNQLKKEVNQTQDKISELESNYSIGINILIENKKKLLDVINNSNLDKTKTKDLEDNFKFYLALQQNLLSEDEQIQNLRITRVDLVKKLVKSEGDYKEYQKSLEEYKKVLHYKITAANVDKLLNQGDVTKAYELLRLKEQNNNPVEGQVGEVKTGANVSNNYSVEGLTIGERIKGLMEAAAKPARLPENLENKVNDAVNEVKSNDINLANVPAAGASKVCACDVCVCDTYQANTSNANKETMPVDDKKTSSANITEAKPLEEKASGVEVSGDSVASPVDVNTVAKPTEVKPLEEKASGVEVSNVSSVNAEGTNVKPIVAGESGVFNVSPIDIYGDNVKPVEAKPLEEKTSNVEVSGASVASPVDVNTAAKPTEAKPLEEKVGAVSSVKNESTPELVLRRMKSKLYATEKNSNEKVWEYNVSSFLPVYAKTPKGLFVIERITTHSKNGLNVLVKLDEKTGKRLSGFSLDDPKINACLYDGGVLYTASEKEIKAYDLDNLQNLWKVKLNANEYQHLVKSGDNLFVSAEGNLVAIDVKNAKINWKREDKVDPYALAVDSKNEGNVYVYTNKGYFIQKIDEDGVVDWISPLQNINGAVWSMKENKDVLYLALGYTDVIAANVKDGKKLWQGNISHGKVFPWQMEVVGNNLEFVVTDKMDSKDSRLINLDSKNGERVYYCIKG